MNKSSSYVWKLGLFVIIGITIFVAAIFFIGKNKNLFGATFHLKSQFKNVSGLKIGNNVRLSGINIGTVENIEFVSDSSVVVSLLIKEEVQKYIKSDAVTSIGSDGLMGDKVLTISPGGLSNTIVKDNDMITSAKAIELDDLMQGMKKSIDNAEVITGQLAVFSTKMNNNRGALSKMMTDTIFANSLSTTLTNLESSSDDFSVFTKKLNNEESLLSKLVNDESLGKSLDTTITNAQKASKGLIEIEAAAKNNFLLRGYFKKQKKAAAKKKVKK